jgi:hypothetical protein
MARLLTEDERNAFSWIRDADNVLLIRAWFDGQEAAVIAAVEEEEIIPLAVLVTDELFSRLTGPGQGAASPQDPRGDGAGPGLLRGKRDPRFSPTSGLPGVPHIKPLAFY